MNKERAVKKRVLVSLMVLGAMALAFPAWAVGPAGLSAVGVYGSAGSSAGKLGGGIGLSLKWRSFPVVGLQYDLSQVKLNASADYYVIDAKGLTGPFSYFVGAGGYAGIGSSGGGLSFDLGLRLPVGIQIWPVKGVELFLSPVLSVPLFPSPQVGLGAEFGVRVRL